MIIFHCFYFPTLFYFQFKFLVHFLVLLLFFKNNIIHVLHTGKPCNIMHSNKISQTTRDYHDV